MHFAPALPVRENVKFTSEIEPPRGENPDDRNDQDAADDEKQS